MRSSYHRSQTLLPNTCLWPAAKNNFWSRLSLRVICLKGPWCYRCTWPIVGVIYSQRSTDICFRCKHKGNTGDSRLYGSSVWTLSFTWSSCTYNMGFIAFGLGHKRDSLIVVCNKIPAFITNQKNYLTKKWRHCIYSQKFPSQIC